ncbi:Snf7-domain-containing protein [Zopfochytrium polystomum]|nr:Snf7-domain-containing protein [Zopfochytrium polystomum]
MSDKSDAGGDADPFASFAPEAVAAAFASFPKKSDNPRLFQARLTLWSDLIISTARSRRLGPNTLVISTQGISEKFKRKNGAVPLGMGIVISELIESRTLLSLSDFHASLSTDPWTLSAIATLPIRYSFHLLTRTLFAVSPVDFVVTPLLDEACAAVLDAFQPTASTQPLDGLLGFDELCGEAGVRIKSIALSRADLALVVKKLRKSGKVALTMDPNGNVELVRFPDAPGTAPAPLTAADAGTVAVRRTISALAAQVAELEAREEALHGDVVRALSGGFRTRAARFLKQKKQVQAVLARRAKSLLTLETVHDRIRAAHADVRVVDSYAAGRDALKAVLKDERLQVDRVDEVVEGLREAMADYKEVEDALAGAGELGMDDEDVEKELEKLVEMEEREELKVRENASHVAHEVSGASMDALIGALEGMEVATEAPSNAPKAKDSKEPVLVE